MADNILISGVTPGGIYRKDELIILVAYILTLSPEPFSTDQLAEVLISTGTANFFEAVESMELLCKEGNAEKLQNEDGYVLTEKGKNFVNPLIGNLTVTVREKVSSVMKEMSVRQRSINENIATVEKTEGGYMVNCSIMDRDKELLTIRLLTSDIDEAHHMRERFIKNPTAFYKYAVSIMSGDISICQNL